MSIAQSRGIGGFLDGARALANHSFASNSTSDNAVEVDGPSIDRKQNGKMPLSACLLIPWAATVASTKTAKFECTLQTAASSTGPWADVKDENGNSVTLPSAKQIVATGTTSTTSFTGCVVWPVDLSACKRYIRVQVTPTLSSTSTGAGDTIAYSGALAFGGHEEEPAE